MTAPATGILFYEGRAKPLSTTGAIQPGSYYLFYTTGTLTPATVYADGTLTTPLSQVPGTGGTTAAADGRLVPIYLNPAITYRYQLYSATNVLLEDVDPFTVTLTNNSGAFADGSVSSPSITFQSDNTTGIYKAAPTTLGITAGGVQQASFSIGGSNLKGPVSVTSSGLTITGGEQVDYLGIGRAPSTGITKIITDNGGSGDSEIVSGSTTAGDPYFRSFIGGLTNWSFGGKRGSGNFTISNGVGLGSNNYLSITTTGITTLGINALSVWPNATYTGNGGEINIVASPGSPTAGRIVWGDGSGWTLNFSKYSSGVFTDLVKFGDSGTTLTVNGPTTANAALSILSGATTGSAYGLSIQAGTNGSDYAFSVVNHASTSSFMQIRGDGSWSLGGNGTVNNTISSTASGVTTISAPSSGVALTVNGVANQNCLNLFGASTSSQSFGLFVAAGTNSNDHPVRISNQAQTSDLFVVRGDGSWGLGLGTNFLSCDSVGRVSIPAPTSAGAAFTANGIAGSNPGVFFSSTTTGQALGLFVRGGTNSSDYGLAVQNATGASLYFEVRGDGAVLIPSLANGSLSVASGVITSSSDIRLKTDIRPFIRGIDSLLNINPITYKWNKETSAIDSDDDFTGFSAQNVEESIPEAVSHNAEGIKSLSDRTIIAVLVNAVKELKAEIEILKGKI